MPHSVRPPRLPSLPLGDSSSAEDRNASLKPIAGPSQTVQLQNTPAPAPAPTLELEPEPEPEPELASVADDYDELPDASPPYSDQGLPSIEPHASSDNAVAIADAILLSEDSGGDYEEDEGEDDSMSGDDDVGMIETDMLDEDVGPTELREGEGDIEDLPDIDPVDIFQNYMDELGVDDQGFQDDYDQDAGNDDNENAAVNTPLSVPHMHDPVKDPMYTCPDDPTEEVEASKKEFDMSDGDLALAMWVNRYDVDRAQFQDLVDLLKLYSNLPPDLQNLPRRVDTLKKRFKSQLPLLKTRRRQLQLDKSMIPSRSKNTEDIVMFDMRDYFRSLVQSERLMARAYQGLAEIVDAPVELWQSDAWGCSVRTTSGQFARYPNNEPVFPSDFIWYRNRDGGNPRLGRVHFVGRDLRAEAVRKGQAGETTLIIHPVYVAGDLPGDVQSQAAQMDPVQAHHIEVFLSDDGPDVYIQEDQVVRREKSIFLDYYFQTKSAPSSRQLYKKKFIVRQVFSSSPLRLRSLALSHPHRAELELDTYGRADTIQRLAQPDKRVISLPYLTFIDAFGVYRNMYRSIMGIYAQFAFLNEYDRSRPINVFPITLGPYGAKWEDIVASLAHLTQLEVGIEMTLDDGTEVIICAPTLAYIGDMPQQQANSGCMSMRANRFCRSCVATKEECGDMEFDTVLGGRYHFEMLRFRKECEHMVARVRLEKLNKQGLAFEQTILRILTPSLDLVVSRPGDAAHSELKGISKKLLELLFSHVVRKQFHDELVEEFSTIVYPPGWARLQNIKRHLGSFSMSECGRAVILTVPILRRWLQEHKLRPKFYNVLKQMLLHPDNGFEFTPSEFVAYCYTQVARCVAVFMGPSIRVDDRPYLLALAVESRQRYQDICVIASEATRKVDRARTGAISPERPPSPTARRLAPPLFRTLSQSSSVTGNEPIFIPDTDRGDVLFGEEENTDNSGEDSEVDARDDHDTIVSKAEKRAMKLLAKKQTPNVHTILHYLKVVEEFASTRNTVTMSGENKHYYFKKRVTKTNHQNVASTMIHGEGRLQTINYVVNGSYIHTDRALTKSMQNLEKKVPHLFSDLSSYGQQDEDNEAFDKQQAVEDPLHLKPAVQIRIPAAEVQSRSDNMASVLFPGRLQVDHPFVSSLLDAYEREYGEAGLATAGTKGVQWSRRLRFSLPNTNRTRVFHVSNFVRISNTEVGQIKGLFTHQLGSKHYVFALLVLADRNLPRQGLIRTAENEGENVDHILQVPTFRMSRKTVIVGLPALQPQGIWVTPTQKPGQYWYIDWDIYYM